MDYFEYKMPTQGLGTDFSQSERPLTFAEVYTNRFRNVTGGAERRPGMLRYGSRIAGNPTLTRLHEYVTNLGVETLMTSDDSGNLWSYNTTTSAWSSILTGKSAVRMLSVQSEEKIIFFNGVDRNFYTKDGVNFSELKAIITTGKTAGGTTTSNLVDGNISNWISQTLVANNDIVYNVTRDGYGIVSTVASASLTTTIIGVSGNGAGKTAANQTSGDFYQLIDYVNLEIFNDGASGTTNVATATTGTTTTVIAVSGVNFANTEIRRGDFVYNTTRAALAQIGSVSANVNLQNIITGQISGDALAFFKSAMPIASWIHVHYGRVYYLDSRNQTRVVISAPDDAQDVTTYQQTLDSTSFRFGTLQPEGDTILCMGSFQQYFVAAGKRNLYIYRGITPISDSSTTSQDFSPISFYPNGVVSRFGLGTNGTDLQHVTAEGLQNISVGQNVSNVAALQTNLALPIRTAVVNLIQQTTADNIQLSFYPRRSWLMMKIGDSIYVLNTNPSYTDAGTLNQFSQSWHLFSGGWAQQNHYFVRRNGDLLACGAGGLVYSLDSSAATDNGTPISTDLATAWIRLEEPQRTPRIKQGQYIRPIFESAAEIEYTINAIAGWDGLSSDSIVVSAGATGAIGSAVIGVNAIGEGAFAQADKFPLRWRGEQARIEFTTQSSASPDVITGFIVYGDIGGVR